MGQDSPAISRRSVRYTASRRQPAFDLVVFTLRLCHFAVLFPNMVAVCEDYFNAKAAKVSAEQRGGRFPWRPWRGPWRPLHCHTPETSRGAKICQSRAGGGTANRREIGRGMNGKGMEHGSPAFIPLPSIPLLSPLEMLDSGSAALRLIGLTSGSVAASSRYAFAFNSYRTVSA